MLLLLLLFRFVYYFWHLILDLRLQYSTLSIVHLTLSFSLYYTHTLSTIFVYSLLHRAFVQNANVDDDDAAATLPLSRYSNRLYVTECALERRTTQSRKTVFVYTIWD